MIVLALKFAQDGWGEACLGWSFSGHGVLHFVQVCLAATRMTRMTEEMRGNG